MIATKLAFSSLRRRTTGFIASFVALFFGATILMTFASLLDTRTAAGPETAKTLLIMASIVGGWGLVIVLFATLSTLSLSLSADPSTRPGAGAAEECRHDAVPDRPDDRR